MNEPRIITIDELTSDLDAGRVAEFWNVLTDRTGRLSAGPTVSILVEEALS